ncbi:HAL/PAL/TAL family ammonia-lyase [Stigmatella aurantiaca]|uniref:Phenylalanine and histidine ammonia-lyase n=2 Tax=Stigmatella aurantiaca TaxID=41 RepID=Q098W6_STIAD|nr:aromatic amino acid ammonia-lyase [Stigmatella aurantiaca]ADO75486.1 Phenylalanine and histidine ammonia-lyase [Stigmatella aurantiaca DW4/3-1]EAU68260.1 phenylalanine and histidine ammonia-lyase [Stigmatella aurantiaca DW4/3-1]
MSQTALYVIIAAMFLRAAPAQADVTLDGKSATPEAIAAIAQGQPVKIAPEAFKRIEQAHRVLLQAAAEGQTIYGLTVGVGLNKDRAMVDAQGKLTEEVIEASRRFQVGLIRAHSGSVGPEMDVRTVRATMAARLNTMLVGGAGVQPEVIDAYVQFLNRGIAPVIPTGGSLGEADITIISHVGLAMLGEGEVYYKGQKTSAAKALQAAGVKPVKLFGKDALAILSSNAYSAGLAALALNDLSHLITVNKLVYALSLQAINGNVSPFLEDTLALRPFPQTVRAGAELRELLSGSSLWNQDATRRLQDPLSFRDSVYVLGEVTRTYDEARGLLNIQLNSSDDNPGVAVNVTPKSQRWQEKKSYVAADTAGAVLPSANFEPLPWVLAFEQLGIALAHNSLTSAQRIIKLDDPNITGLERYLGTEKTVHAFGAMEKPVVALALENKVLATPVSTEFLPVAGGIEDIATNAPEVVKRVQKQIDNSYALLGIESIHSAQAIDLRRASRKEFTLAPATTKLYGAVRRKVAFLDEDRPLTPDFRAAAEVLRNYHD